MSQIDLGDLFPPTSKKFHDCIVACLRCMLACEVCADACLDEDDVEKMVSCIRTDRDCAEACRAAIAAMARGSENAADFCRLCAEICERCAEECGKHDADHCRRCAEACRACAEECRKMAA